MNKFVLMYHCVYKESLSESGFQNITAFPYKIKKDIFVQQVGEIDRLCNLGKFNRDSIQFTFDDGGLSSYTIIAPVLEQYGFKGLFFISTKYINQKGFLSTEQIKKLSERGHVIGSHSHSHPSNISRLTSKEISLEWSVSKKILSKICGKEINYVSVPNGDVDNKVIRFAKEEGFKYLYTSHPTIKVKRVEDIDVYGRYGIHDTTSLSEILNFLSSPLFRIKRNIRWNLLFVVKYILGEKYNLIKTEVFRLLK